MPIGDIPILEIVLKQLADYDFKRVIVTLGHMAHLFVASIGDGSKFRIQVIVVPNKTKRFFILLEESGTICLLAAFSGLDRKRIIPKFGIENEAKDLQSIAEEFLRYHGYEPVHYEDEDDAKSKMDNDLKKMMYPLLLTPLDTSGEKTCEEFVGEGETVSPSGMPNLMSIDYKSCDTGKFQTLLKKIQEWINGSLNEGLKQDIIEAVSGVIPEMEYTSSEKSLDERM